MVKNVLALKEEAKAVIESVKKDPSEENLEQLITLKLTLIKKASIISQHKANLEKKLNNFKNKPFYSYKELQEIKDTEDNITWIDALLELISSLLQRLELSLLLALPYTIEEYITKIGKYLVKVEDGVITQITDISS